MNLWLRMLWMLLTVRFRSRATIFEPTSIRMTVLPNDLDFNGHVNNGRYFTLADVGRMDFVVRTGTARLALARRARPIVGDAMAKFRKDLKPFQRFELKTRILGWDRKWVFMEHRFIRGGRTAGIVVMRGLFVDPDGPMTPADLLSGLGVDQPSPALPAWVADWSRSCDDLALALRQEETPLTLASGGRRER